MGDVMLDFLECEYANFSWTASEFASGNGERRALLPDICERGRLF